MLPAERDRQFTNYVMARRGHLRRAAYLLCGDWSAAEDLVQASLVKLYLAWPRVDADSPEPYARKILLRTYLDERRRMWRRERPSADVPELPRTDDPSFEDAEALRAALATLPRGQRATVVLRYWYGMSVQEAAAELGCSSGTVKSQTSKAIAALRTVLGEDRLPEFVDADQRSTTRSGVDAADDHAAPRLALPQPDTCTSP